MEKFARVQYLISYSFPELITNWKHNLLRRLSERLLLFGIMGDQLRPAMQYIITMMIDGFQKMPSSGGHDAERRQTLGCLYARSW